MPHCRRLRGGTRARAPAVSVTLRLRHLGSGPLVEDDSARSDPTTVVNVPFGYRYRQRYTITAQLLNLLDSGDHDITHYYASRLRGEPADGVEDDHFHPAEPRMLRATLGLEF